MKIRRLCVLIGLFFVLAIVAFPVTSHAVVNWTKNPDNPILVRGGSDTFDEWGLYRPAVINDGGTYKMWYTGIDEVGSISLGYTISSNSNGTLWENSHSQVFTKGASGSWDASHVGYASIIKDGETYKMWYSGTDNPDGNVSWQIGYATSPNGTTWTRYQLTPPNLPKGGADDWDGGSVILPCVIKDGDNSYKMWYLGWNSTNTERGIGYATSEDGITWIKYNNNSAPVIQLGLAGTWDYFRLASPTVIKDGGVYRMWYDGMDAPGSNTRIGYAYSYDGISWIKYEGNPVLSEGTPGSFDEYGPFDAMVLKDGNTYRMYYAGSRDCLGPSGCIDEIGYAESYLTLYASIPGDGIMKWDGSVWSQLHSLSPANMAASGSTLYATFTGYGLYKWDGSAWTQLHSIDPVGLAVSGSTLYVNFTEFGLYKWDGSAWTQLHSIDPVGLAVSGSTLYVNFTEFGLYKWDGSAWTQLHSLIPANMAASGSTLYATFTGYGLYKWDGSAWTQLHSIDPVSIAVSDSTLYVNFTDFGLWKWQGGAWSQLHSLVPSSMVALGSELYATFTGYGIWKWDGSAWSQVNSNDPAFMVAGF